MNIEHAHNTWLGSSESLKLPWTESLELPWKTELELEAGSSRGRMCCASLKLRALSSIVGFAPLEVMAIITVECHAAGTGLGVGSVHWIVPVTDCFTRVGAVREDGARAKAALVRSASIAAGWGSVGGITGAGVTCSLGVDAPGTVGTDLSDSGGFVLGS